MEEEGASGHTRFPYQPALDGFRAFAVAAVLLYHDGTAPFPGGFLGVDAFFVLSGYLITTLLVLEWQRAGRIRLRSFWARRGRRLLPALLATVLLIALYAVLAAAPEELERIRGDGLATLLYVQNWRLVLTHQSYFDQFVAPSPFRHAWSLAIEEQWYLIWPFVIAGLLHITRGRLPRVIPLVAILALVSGSLMVLLYTPGGDPSRVYYGTDTRSQTLLVGALLGLVLLWRGLPRARGLRVTVEIAGLVAGAYALWMLTRVNDVDSWMYRGGLSLAAITFALIILAAVQPGGFVVRRVLAFEPFRRVGLISYGVYLYHWPIFLWLTPSRIGISGWALLGVRVTVTFSIATVSYVAIEMPVRRRTFPRSAWLVAAPATAVVVTVVLVAATVGGGARGVAIAAMRSDARYRPVGPAPPGVPSVLTSGDSQAYELASGLGGPRGMLRTLGIWEAAAARLGCGVLGGEKVVGNRRGVGPNCGDAPALRKRGVDDIHPDVALFLVGAWEVFDRRLDGRFLAVGTAEYEHRLDQALDAARGTLTARGARFVILTTPCFAQVERFANDGSRTRNDPRRIAWLNGVWRRYAASHADTTSIIDLHAFLCDRNGVRPQLARLPVWRDGVHITGAGREPTWKWLVTEITKVVAQHPRERGGA